MFIRRQNIKNKNGTIRTYLQICESKRVNGKPRPNVLMNLGRVDTPDGKETVENLAKLIVNSSELFSLLNLEKDLETEWSKNYGLNLIFSEIWHRLGFHDVLSSFLNHKKTDFDLCDCLYNMTLNRLDEPSSKRGLVKWQQKIFDLNHYQLHQYYRSMDHLMEHKEDIEKKLFSHLRLKYNQTIDIVLFDTTTLVYYGDAEHGEALLARGFSKAKRGDLKQIVVGVVMSAEGIPLAHEVFSGNKNDVTCFKEVIDKMSNKFKVRKVVLVGDRGMISKKNLEHLNQKGYEYILGYRMRTIPKEDRIDVLSKAKLNTIKKKTLHFKDIDYKGHRLIVCYNPERAEIDKKRRDDIVDRLKQKIIGKTIQSVVSNPDYKRFLKIDGKSPQIDQAKVSKDELYDGVFVLTTNTDIKPKSVVEHYKDLWQIEAGFRCLKDELEAGPIFHWKDRRIEAHVMTCFFALIIRTEFNRCLKLSEKEYSYSDVISDLSDFDVVSLKIKSNRTISRTNLNHGTKLALSALKMKTPKKVLHSEQTKQLIL
jgi:transposase